MYLYVLGLAKLEFSYTANPFSVMKTGFSLCSISNRENPVFITGIPANGNRFFPVRKSIQRKPCFHYRDGFAVEALAMTLTFKKMHVYTRNLREIFREVKETLLKS